MWDILQLLAGAEDELLVWIDELVATMPRAARQQRSVLETRPPRPQGLAIALVVLEARGFRAGN